jgi:cobalt-zinc-cadmium efflux system outer membrane protein
MLRFLFLFLAFVAGSLAAEVPFTLESAPAYALRHNLGLAAARLRIDEARGRLHQAGRLSNPEVELELNRNIRAPEGAVSVTLMQKFPLTARLRLEKNATRAELAAAEAEVRNAERKLIAEVRTAAVKLLGLGGQKALRETQLGHSRELAGFLRQRVGVGEASLVEASLVDLEAQQLETEVLQLDVERAALVGELRPLLGLSAGQRPVFAGTLPAVDGLPGAGVETAARPDFAAAQRTAEAARQSVLLARAQTWQDLGVGFNVSEQRAEDAPEGFQRDTFVGLRFSLQLPFWNKNTGRIQEATAAAARAEKEVDALALTIDAEAAAARDAMAVLSKLVRSLDTELLPKAAQIEQQLRDSYSTGQIALTEVLRARDRRLLIERQRLDALRDYHLARIRHDAATARGIPATSRGK